MPVGGSEDEGFTPPRAGGWRASREGSNRAVITSDSSSAEGH